MADQWYYVREGRRHGPVAQEQLKQLAASGQLKPVDLVWKKGLATWMPAAEVVGFFDDPPPLPPRQQQTPRDLLEQHFLDQGFDPATAQAWAKQFADNDWGLDVAKKMDELASTITVEQEFDQDHPKWPTEPNGKPWPMGYDGQPVDPEVYSPQWQYIKRWLVDNGLGYMIDTQEEKQIGKRRWLPRWVWGRFLRLRDSTKVRYSSMSVGPMAHGMHAGVS